MLSSTILYSQNYPPELNLSDVNWGAYQSPTSVPNYLEEIIESLSNNRVIRISDETVFGCDCSQLRHRYSKNRPWNADETKIMTGGSPSKIIDAETYEVLGNVSVKSLWSNVDPDLTYDAAGNSTFVKRNIVTGVTSTLRQFSQFTSISVGYSEGNLSNDDRWVALIGINGNNKTLIVYDIENDEIVGELFKGTVGIDWISMSQSGEYVVVSHNTSGSGANRGVKSYNRDFSNETHLVNGHPHGDIGFDMAGNEVFVHYGNTGTTASIGYTRLDNGNTSGTFNYSGATGDRGLWGGHVSTRNIDRPGWAYISDQGHPNDVDRFEATREIFAIKLDGSNTIQRFAKHNTVTSSYLHESHAVPNRDGTKVIFASNWDNNAIEANTYPLMFVVEVPQESGNVNANAGQDQNICIGETATLSASGGTNYLWSTGETSESIEVSPDMTTSYSVTVSEGNSSDTDEVIVSVNALPDANAGGDQEICEGQSITLGASGGATYLWSTGDTTQNIEVSPNSTTTYSVTVSSSEGCSDSDSVVVLVNSLPNANAGDDITINEGESATLSASGGSNYLWSTGEATQSIQVSPLTTESYSVTVTSSEGCSSDDEIIVTVIPIVVNANAGEDQSICDGTSTVLSASGGSNYLWSTGETTQSIEVNPNTTTSYSVTVSEGNSSDTDEVIVSVNALPDANAGGDQEICEGQSITLGASGGATYLWSTGDTTQNIEVSPNSTTTYSVTVSSSEGCSDSDSVVVLVNSLPNANAGDDITINEGESATLSASGGSNYLWSTGEATQSIQVSPLTTESYSVTVTSSEGCSSDDEIIVTVIPIVVNANAGEDQSICDGTSTVLSASGGSNYLWSTGETTQSIEVNPNTTTSYSVTVSEGNSSDTDDVMVVVNDSPDTYIVNGDEEITIADGQFITLSADGADSYLWFNGATDANIAISPTEDTLVYVEGFENNCSSMDEIVIRVVPAVEATVLNPEVFICLGESTVLNASGGDNYLWSTGETTSSITVLPDDNTTYTVTVFDEFSSDEAEVNVVVEDCSEGLLPSNEIDFQFLISPNPAASYTHIDLGGLYDISNVVIFDLLGKQVYNTVIENEEGSPIRKTINLSNLNSGMYLVKLKTSDTEIIKKLIINK